MRGRESAHRARRRVLVGNPLFHTVGDRSDAIGQLSEGYAALQTEIMTLAGWRADPYHAAEGPLWDWWKVVGLPVISSWQAFQAMQTAAYGTRWATDWDTYKQWLGYLRDLRAKAKAHGVRLTTPEPHDLSTTLVEDAGHAISNFGHDVKEKLGEGWTLAKVAVYGGLGVVGAIALTSVVSNLRSGSDPVATWRNR